MTTFSGPLQPFSAIVSAKDFPAAVEIRFAQIVGRQAGPAEPATRSHGTEWYALGAVGRADGIWWWNSSLSSGAGDWVFSHDPAAGRLLQAGATVGGTLNMGGYPLTGLAHSSAPDSAARRDRAVDPQAPQVLANINMANGSGGFAQLVNTGEPTAPSHVMRRADFASGVATLSLVSGQDSTTGDVDLGFVPRALVLQLRDAAVDGVTQLTPLHAGSMTLAQPLSGNVPASLFLFRSDGSTNATPFATPGTVVIVNATAKGFRLNVPRVVSGVGGQTFGGARGISGAVHWMAWR